MKKIDAVIVVEGKHDSAKLKKYFDVETIETSGSYLSDDRLKLIQKTALTNKVILLLDPDSVGDRIRMRINQAIPGLINCFIFKEDAKTKTKVGVEHANYETLNKALQHHLVFKDNLKHLNYNDMIELGLSGFKNSNLLRLKISKYFQLGKCNAKTMLKRLNMLGIDKEKIKEIL